MSKETQTKQEQLTLDVHIGNAVDWFLVDGKARGLRPKTIEFYEQRLALFIKFCETQAVYRIEQIDAPLIRQFLLWLEERGNNPGGRHACYRALKAFLLWLEREEDNYKSPIHKVQAPKVDIQPIKGVSDEDFIALINTCKSKSVIDLRDKALLLMIYDTGLRVGELLNLTVDDLDLNGGSCLVKNSKSRKPRVAFFSRQTARALRAYLKARKDRSKYLWITNDGWQASYTTVRDMLRRRGSEAGLDTIPSPHDFRRAAALSMLRNGADVVSVSRILGHSSVQVTQRYLAQTDNDLQEVHQMTSPLSRLKL